MEQNSKPRAESEACESVVAAKDGRSLERLLASRCAMADAVSSGLNVEILRFAQDDILLRE
jgi:hypothetical protein